MSAIGDRVTVLCPTGRRNRISPKRGQIIGESRGKTSWRVKLDHLQEPIGYHKSFVVTETVEKFNERLMP